MHKGSKFPKIYSESLEFLWNFARSLFVSYLYHNFEVIEHYETVMDSYVYFFCIDYINKIGIEMEDLDNDYSFNQATIERIYKFFNEKINKLHRHKRGDFDLHIKEELENLRNLWSFE